MNTNANTITSIATLAAVGISLAAPATAPAQWPADPAENLAIADRPSEQVIPKIAATPDGGVYIAWFDLASGSYDVYLQRLDAAGVEQFPHNGLLISDEPQNTFLVDWDLIADSQGNAVIVFTDIRDGGDLDVHAYRVSPGGDFLWGAEGVALSANLDFEPAPRVAEASDGDFVFVWSRLPDTADGTIVMQRLSPEGVPQLQAGGLPIAGAPGEDPGFAAIVAADDGNVIVSWVRDTAFPVGLRHVKVEKFAPDGTSVWGEPVSVFDAFSVPIAYTPKLHGDGNGGALVLWHRSDNTNLFNCFVQHLDADGSELFPHNGIAVSTNTAVNHIDPALAYRADTGEILVFWNQRNPAQSMWGISGQKLSSDGTRQWGNAGLSLLPVDAVNKSGPRAVPYADGAMVFLSDEPTGQFGLRRALGLRVDGDGAPVWDGSPVVLSSVLSTKSRLPIAINGAGMVVAAWEDDRNGTPDVYAQNVNPDGSLGVTAVPGDVTGDGIVDVADLIAVILAWGPCPAPPDPCPEDLDESGSVDVTDLIAVILAWS
jgi:hypothetical protein